MSAKVPPAGRSSPDNARPAGHRRPGRPYLADGPAVTAEAIVAAARTTLQGSGTAGLSLREVARRVGVSLPTVQRHFATKDDLWRACVDSVLADTLLALPDPDAVPAALPGEGLARYISHVVARSRAVPSITAAVLNDAEPGAEGRLDYLSEQAGPLFERAREGLERAIASGVARRVEPNALMALLGLGLSSVASSGEGLRRLFGIDLDDKDQAEAFARDVTDLVLHGFLA
jgi:AcrR family transcriptional regulator